MKRRVIREVWTITSKAEAQVLHDALGMVRDVVDEGQLSQTARLDLDRALREVTIANTPRMLTRPEKTWGPGAALHLEMGVELISQLTIAFEILRDWSQDSTEPGLTPEQQDALVAFLGEVAR